MKISVCMTTYNGERFIKEQLDSILKQLSTKDEVIISDDGSTDETIEIINSYKDNRIRLYHSKHRNVILNFESALKRVTGEIIFLSDQDDIWKDNKIEKSLESLRSNLLVFSNALIFDVSKPSEEILLYKDTNLTGFFNNIYKNNYIGATMAFKTDLLRFALPFPKLIPMHDMWLGLLAEIKGKTAYIEEPLIYYRRHLENVSSTGSKSNNSLYKKIQYRVQLLGLLCKRIFF